MKTKNTRTVVVKMIGVVPVTCYDGYVGYDGLAWKVRAKAPRFPFFIDSDCQFANKADAEKFASNWSKRKIEIKIT